MGYTLHPRGPRNFRELQNTIDRAFERIAGKISKAAVVLKLRTSCLRRIMDKFNIERIEIAVAIPETKRNLPDSI